MSMESYYTFVECKKRSGPMLTTTDHRVADLTHDIVAFRNTSSTQKELF
jgi:hypothetical protein